MKKHFILTAAFALTIGFVIAQVPSDYSFRQSFNISTPAEMNISTSDGFIKSYSNSSSQIQVYFIVRKNNKAMDMDLSELEEHVDVDISSSNDVLDITIKQRQTNWMKNWKDRYYVSLHILAPAKTECNLRTSDGDIELIGFQGRQSCRTSDGDISVSSVGGNLNARTSDGDVQVEEVKGSVELITSDGDIIAKGIVGEIDLKTSDGKIYGINIDGDIHAVTSDGNIVFENVKGEHSARTSDGNIVFEGVLGSIEAQTSDGDIRGDLRDVMDRLYLKTSDGDISVSVPTGLGMDVRLKGEDINTRLDNFSGNTSDNLVEGTIHGGGVEVELVTSDGDINLNYN